MNRNSSQQGTLPQLLIVLLLNYFNYFFKPVNPVIRLLCKLIGLRVISQQYCYRPRLMRTLYARQKSDNRIFTHTCLKITISG
jgi:hypothetical protein